MIAMMSFMAAAPPSVARRRRGGADATPVLAGLSRQRRRCLKTMPNATIYGKEKSFIRRELSAIFTAQATCFFERNTHDMHLRRPSAVYNF
jgi:hypothetical protein